MKKDKSFIFNESILVHEEVKETIPPEEIHTEEVKKPKKKKAE